MQLIWFSRTAQLGQFKDIVLMKDNFPQPRAAHTASSHPTAAGVQTIPASYTASASSYFSLGLVLRAPCCEVFT